MDAVALVVERRLADSETAKTMSRKDLLDLLGEQQSTQQALNPLKITGGTRLHPQALCSQDDDSILVFDGPTNAVWLLKILTQRGNYTGSAKLLFSIPNLDNARSVSCSNTHIYVASSADNGGLFGFHCQTNALSRLVINDSNSKVYGVCSSRDNAVFFTTASGVFKYTDNDGATCISGSKTSTAGQKLVTRDGFSSNAAHAQCGPIYISRNTLTVADLASLSIRLVTSVNSLLKYHKTINRLFQAFSIHSGKAGYRETMDTTSMISNLQDLSTVYNEMLQEIRDIHQNQSLKPNGPHGSLPYITIKMFNDLTQNVINLIDTIKSNRQQYPINPNSLLSLPCEHHFSTMRSRYQMPTLLQYCEQLNDVVNESLKRLTISSYHYFTHKDSFYPRPELHGIDVYVTPRPNQPSKHSRLSASDSALMRNWRVDFCAGMYINIVWITAFHGIQNLQQGWFKML